MDRINRRARRWAGLTALGSALLVPASTTRSIGSDEVVGGRNWRACGVSLLLLLSPTTTSAGIAMVGVFC